MASSDRGAVHRFDVPPDLVRRLRSVAAGSDGTLFTTLLSAWSVLLGRFTGETTVPIGIPVSGRPKPELERVVGPFVNSVIMRADLGGQPTFQELVTRMTAALGEDLTHQDLPFELLVEHLQWPRRADRNPVFQVMFQLQVADRPGARSMGPDVPGGHSPDSTALEPDAVTSQLDVSCIQVETAAGGIEGGIVYATDLLDTATVTGLADAYLTLLADAALRPSVAVADLRLTSDAARAQIHARGRGERRDWPDRRMDTWLDRQAAAFADRTAVVPGIGGRQGSMTFRDLWHAAEGYACAFERVGVIPGRIVAIGLSRSLQLVAAVLGVLRAGAAFLCLDPRAPAPRREFILSDCDAAAVVVPPGAEALACGRPCVVRPDEVGPGGRGTGSAARSPDDPAYVVYTSGSTGEPKGVLIPHAALVNHMHWMLERFRLTGSDLLLQRTPLTFDASVWELFAPLLSGSRLVLAPDEPVFDPVRLGRVLREHGITTLQVVPSILRALLTSGELGRCGSLQRIFSGGEPLTAELRDDVLAASPAELVNLYGPTETTIDATFHVCDRDDHREFVPIGRPVANAVLHVLDDHGATVPLGGVGELHIGGAPVASGYRRQTRRYFAEHRSEIPFLSCAYGGWMRSAIGSSSALTTNLAGAVEAGAWLSA